MDYHWTLDSVELLVEHGNLGTGRWTAMDKLVVRLTWKTGLALIRKF